MLAHVKNPIASDHAPLVPSPHSYPTNSIMIHSYPSLEHIAEIQDTHVVRIGMNCHFPHEGSRATVVLSVRLTRYGWKAILGLFSSAFAMCLQFYSAR